MYYAENNEKFACGTSNRFFFFDSARGRKHVFVHEDQNVTRSTTGTTAASL